MHRMFPQWYRDIHLQPTEDIVAKRWAGVEAAAKGLDAKKALTLGALLCGDHSDESFVHSFVETFREADALFPMRDHSRELQLLAGAVLAHGLSDSKAQLQASLVILAQRSGSAETTPMFPELVKEATTKLHEASQSRGGTAPSKADPKIANALAPWGEPFRQNSVNSIQPEQVKAPFEALAKSMGTNFERLLDHMETQNQLLAEEMDMLWWTLIRSSRDLGVPFDKTPDSATPLIIGKELADLVSIHPGPVAAYPLLGKVCPRPTEAADVRAAIESAPNSWKQHTIQTAKPDILRGLPLHHMLHSGQAHGDVPFSRHELAYQMYVERLLLDLAQGE